MGKGPIAPYRSTFYRNIDTGLRQEKETGPIVSYCAGPVPSPSQLTIHWIAGVKRISFDKKQICSLFVLSLLYLEFCITQPVSATMSVKTEVLFAEG